MKFRFLVSTIILFSIVTAIYTVSRNGVSVSAQEPRRWFSGDTLWFEIDSLPLMPSVGGLYDTAYLWLLPLHERAELRIDGSPHKQMPPRIVFDYSLPYWSVYRRSFTVWGITFSTGQASPFSPYPAESSLNANVLSFPLQPPR